MVGKKNRGNYNQGHFKLGGSMQPDIVQERRKRQLTQRKGEQPKPSKETSRLGRTNEGHSI